MGRATCAMSASAMRSLEPDMCDVIDKSLRLNLPTTSIIQILRRNSSNPYSNDELRAVIEALTNG